MPGDLVISCLEDIRHPARHDILFGKHFWLSKPWLASQKLQEWLYVHRKKAQIIPTIHEERAHCGGMGSDPIRKCGIHSSKNISRKFISNALDNNFVPLSPCSPKAVRVLKKGHSGSYRIRINACWRPLSNGLNGRVTQVGIIILIAIRRSCSYCFKVLA